jgi:NAD-dependent dihydropyrimidine dehydrogenase PreA subunit
MKRTIIRIDQEKCNGCGLCVPACAEGALQIIDGKAKIVSDKFCDGLGACLGKCPVAALAVETREAEAFDEEAVKHHKKTVHVSERKTMEDLPQIHSMLSQWPIQLLLVPTNVPFLKSSDLVISADCVGFAYANFHLDLLKERKLVIGCPKLDDVQFYRKKLEALLKESQPRSVTVVQMEIPCCSALYKIVEDALASAGVNIPLKREIISVRGNKIQTR